MHVLKPVVRLHCHSLENNRFERRREVGTATVVVLRAMTRRWRTAELDESEGPYGPRPDLRELSEEPT